jgi:hypothetical protein
LVNTWPKALTVSLRSVVEGVDLVAAQRGCTLGDDTELGGDARRGAGVVAGDHDDPQASALRLPDRHGCLGPGRVDDADHAQVDELVFECFEPVALPPLTASGRQLDVGERAEGDAERPQAPSASRSTSPAISAGARR